jgi:hypothetical protein
MAINTTIDGLDIKVSRSSPLRCERCWNHVEVVEIHDYWPTWRVCARCVQVLLEIKAPPFILRSGSEETKDADYYITRGESEWHQIKMGKIDIPLEP